MNKKNLTKKQLKELNTILCNLRDASEYIYNPSILGVARKTDKPLGCDYKIINPICIDTCTGLVENIQLVNHHIGSKFTSFQTALHQLEVFLQDDKSC